LGVAPSPKVFSASALAIRPAWPQSLHVKLIPRPVSDNTRPKRSGPAICRTHSAART
jgi:hypothetical protein